ncbi:hypothetical protein ACOALZ_14715 [Nocardiopsis algeriensis]|uniref:hypothetical protein n=1 Tax=Nocardiopsis algeriensis TaxID=1478215 RepID=UPI003B435A7C
MALEWELPAMALEEFLDAGAGAPGDGSGRTRSGSVRTGSARSGDAVTEPLAVARERRRKVPLWAGLCLAGVVALAGATVVAVVAWRWAALGGEETPRAVSQAVKERPCPARVSEMVPGGEGTLVEAYETGRHRIVLCADGSEQLYYFGEFLDGSGEPMLVPAERTESGYTARSGQTGYEIADGQVVVTGGDGEVMARHDLVETAATE